jgi:hypothetical protein
MIVSYEINILCDAQANFGQFGSCAGCFTSAASEKVNLRAAIREARENGWVIYGRGKDRTAICSACADANDSKKKEGK